MGLPDPDNLWWSIYKVLDQITNGNQVSLAPCDAISAPWKSHWKPSIHFQNEFAGTLSHLGAMYSTYLQTISIKSEFLGLQHLSLEKKSI